MELKFGNVKLKAIEKEDSEFVNYNDGNASWQSGMTDVCGIKEIGGYIELDTYIQAMLHENATVALNSASSCLSYLIKAKNIKKMLLPKFMCNSAKTICDRENVIVKFYSVGTDFMPRDIYIEDNEWIYIVNYYGQINNNILDFFAKEYVNVIFDNVQAYYQMPLSGIDTIYTCRKFFGVPDGAFLYTDTLLDEDLLQDESYDRMRFILGRYERTAPEFYKEYVRNNDILLKEPVKKMSKLTYNLLHGIDYNIVKKRRTENFKYLHDAFKDINRLKLEVPEGAFMYPLFVNNGREIRKKLCNDKIYVPLLWNVVLDICEPLENEYIMAENILPLPVDQRYDMKVMKYIINKVKYYMG